MCSAQQHIIYNTYHTQYVFILHIINSVHIVCTLGIYSLGCHFLEQLPVADFRSLASDYAGQVRSDLATASVSDSPQHRNHCVHWCNYCVSWFGTLPRIGSAGNCGGLLHKCEEMDVFFVRDCVGEKVCGRLQRIPCTEGWWNIPRVTWSPMMSKTTPCNWTEWDFNFFPFHDSPHKCPVFGPFLAGALLAQGSTLLVTFSNQAASVMRRLQKLIDVGLLDLSQSPDAPRRAAAQIGTSEDRRP